MRNLSYLLAVLLAGLLLAALCGPPDALAGQVVLRDAMGREVVLRLPARRIVSLAPSATETLFALGAQSLIVGVSKSCDYPLEAKLQPRLGDFNTPDHAKVAAAAPDLVLFAEYARQSDLEALTQAGIAGYVLPAGSVQDVAAAIARLGEITGRADAAARLTADIVRAVKEIGDRIAGAHEPQSPRVYIEVDGPEKLYAVGPGSFMDDIVRLAGGRNVFADGRPAYFPIDPAEVIAADPDVILIDYPFQYKVGAAKRPGWGAIAAVRKGRVYDGTDYDIILFNRPGPRIAQALREIARLLHPQAFREQ